MLIESKDFGKNKILSKTNCGHIFEYYNDMNLEGRLTKTVALYTSHSMAAYHLLA